MIIKGERDFIDVWHYIVGNYRYKLYYSKKWKWLIRKHIREQIDYRIQWMDEECFKTGSCKICGCETTALQMCNKACDKPCYPVMMKRYSWKLFQNGSTVRDKNGIWIKILTKNGKPLLLKENKYGYFQNS